MATQLGPENGAHRSQTLPDPESHSSPAAGLERATKLAPGSPRKNPPLPFKSKPPGSKPPPGPDGLRGLHVGRTLQNAAAPLRAPSGAGPAQPGPPGVVVFRDATKTRECVGPKRSELGAGRSEFVFVFPVFLSFPAAKTVMARRKLNKPWRARGEFRGELAVKQADRSAGRLRTPWPEFPPPHKDPPFHRFANEEKRCAKGKSCVA